MMIMLKKIVLLSSLLTSIRSLSGISKKQRFDSIKELISSNAEVVADIGCDHGLLALSIAADYSNVHKVHAIDISPSALDGARRNTLLRPISVQQKINIIEGDGLNAIVSDQNVDTVICAGMGTTTAREICNHNHLDNVNCNEVILQPWPPHILPVLKLYQHFINTKKWIIEDQRIIQSGHYQHLTTKFVRSNNDIINDKTTNDNNNSLLNWPLTQRLLTNNAEHSTESKVFIDYLRNQNNNFFRVKKAKSKVDDDNDKNHDDYDIVTNTERDILQILETYTVSI